MGQMTPKSKRELAEGRKVEALKHTEVLRILNHKHEKPLQDWTYRAVPLPKVKTIFFWEAGQTCDRIKCPCFTLARPREIIRVTTSTGIVRDHIWRHLRHNRVSQVTLLVLTTSAGTVMTHGRACNEALDLPLPHVRAKLDRLVILLQHHGKTCGELTSDDFPRLQLVRMIVLGTAALCILVDNGQYGDLMDLCKFRDAGRLRKLYRGTSMATANLQPIQWMTSNDYFESEGADSDLGADEWEQWSEVTY
jgi:hypothetical protein